MIELNRTERRALLWSTLVLLLAAVARLGLAPGKADFGWHPAPGVPRDPLAKSLTEATRAVDSAVARTARAARPLRSGDKIDPNRAPPEELERLPGIGPSRARAIVRSREKARFRSPEDLLAVPGIGARTLARIRPYISLP